MSAWKPGDVAAVTLMGGERVVAIRNRANDGWLHAGDFGGGSAYDNIGAHETRPLVVIDPEDHEQVEALSERIRDAEKAHGQDFWEYDQKALRDALRSLLADPKPDEPQGLGAVVEDDRGVRWVRAESAKGIRNPWQATLHPSERDTVRQLAYADVAAVKVLSEGVS